MVGLLVATGGTNAGTNGTAAGAPRLQLHTLATSRAVSAVARAGGRAYLVNDVTDQLFAFDERDGRTGAQMHLPGRPVALLAAAGHLWVADMVSNTVDETLGSVHDIRTVSVPSGPAGLAVLDGRIWVASVIAGDVTPIDPATGHVGTPIPVAGGAVRIAAGFGALWVTGTTDQLTELQPRPSGPPTQRVVTVGQGPIGVATGAGAVWVADAEAGTVARVDPLTLSVRPVAAGADPVAVAVAGGRVWVANGGGQQLRIVFPAPASRPVALGATPRALLAVGDGVWVATANPGRVVAAQRGAS